MVVKNLNTGESFFNDDCLGLLKSSCAFMPVSGAVNTHTFRITVFAAQALRFGIADVIVDGQTVINFPSRSRETRRESHHVESQIRVDPEHFWSVCLRFASGPQGHPW